MWNSLNKVQIIGNLTDDPDIKETPNGQKVATFSVATNRKWKDKNDQLQEETEYNSIVAWRWLADIIEKYTSKGKKVYVAWYLKTRTWEDKEWVKKSKTEIIADNIILLSANPNAKQNTWVSVDDFPTDDEFPQ